MSGVSWERNLYNVHNESHQAIVNIFRLTIDDNLSPRSGKQRVNLATFTTKEHLDFPVANHYYIDNITFAILLTGKLHAH